MKNIFTFFVCFVIFNQANAQVATDSEIYKQLKSRDSLLFDVGFNHCKIDEYKNFISDDLEFYHDQGGLSTTKGNFLQAIRDNICSNPDKKPLRKLMVGSLEIFPLYKDSRLYGAIQNGIHDFYIKEPNIKAYKTSSAKFTHVWILENDKWMLKRVLSYDHKSPE
ncbi:DUF4440 domain-containing protein [Christiangramia forsetii]|uniref:Uncharacterized protein n=2 Tax=Christiangramia forsetii TaxID=411153 RepID=A0M3H4_CHRFK|nr:DUF4440 domain-containing protein [Christiangramia forsetii]GGG25856.1 hypothetical protein GCM10011532_06510 [Christiangramia forsetii]CAL67169.1 conserved hypothetical protein, secreted [Christiangramia forsetii KT0803]